MGRSEGRREPADRGEGRQRRRAPASVLRGGRIPGPRANRALLDWEHLGWGEARCGEGGLDNRVYPAGAESQLLVIGLLSDGRRAPGQAI